MSTLFAQACLSQFAEVVTDLEVQGRASVAQLYALRLVIWRLQVDPHWIRQHSFAEIDHEIFSAVILSLPLIEEGQLSVSEERTCSTG